MGKSRPSYPMDDSQNNTYKNESMDDNDSSNFDGNPFFEPAIEIPSEDEIVEKSRIKNSKESAKSQLKLVNVQSLVHANHSNNGTTFKRKRIEEATTTGCASPPIEDFSPIPAGPSSLNLNNDDYYFLMSLHPYMTQFNGSQKLKVRMKIQKLIFKELYKDDIDDDK